MAAAAGLLGLLVVWPVWGEQPPSGNLPAPTPSRSGLEGALEEALRNNPDLKVAQAKVAEAQAVLHQVQLQLAQKVVQAHYAVEAAQAVVEVRKREFERFRSMAQERTVPADVVAEKEKLLAGAKAQAASAEADLAYLLGKGAGREYQPAEALIRGKLRALDAAMQRAKEDPGEAERLRQAITVEYNRVLEEARRLQVEGRSEEARRYEETYRAWVRALAAAAQGPTAEKVREALRRPVSVNFNDVPLRQALQDLEKLSGLHIQAGNMGEGRTVNARLERVPLASVLQLLEDVMPGYRIVVRDYGLLVAHETQLPPGAVGLADLRKGAPSGGSPEGVVKAVDEKGGGVLRLVFKDSAELSRGQMLHAYRLGGPGQSVYLGTVVIVEVNGKEAVARQMALSTSKTIQVGDLVVEKLPTH
jgi:hypothetical protein